MRSMTGEGAARARMAGGAATRSLAFGISLIISPRGPLIRLAFARHLLPRAGEGGAVDRPAALAGAGHGYPHRSHGPPVPFPRRTSRERCHSYFGSSVSDKETGGPMHGNLACSVSDRAVACSRSASGPAGGFSPRLAFVPASPGPLFCNRRRHTRLGPLRKETGMTRPSRRIRTRSATPSCKSIPGGMTVTSCLEPACADPAGPG